jgi:hypothetical protein
LYGFKIHFILRLAVDACNLEPFLEGLTLCEALSKNKIFIVDLEVMHNIPCREIVPKV